jgi:hypothetical protein
MRQPPHALARRHHHLGRRCDRERGQCQAAGLLHSPSSVHRQLDIPRCPACGGYLERNPRKDGQFVEASYEQGRLAYNAFLERAWNGRLVLLEMGVGFNTPVIIRWPFERVAATHPRASLLRVNLDDARIPKDAGHGSLGFKVDAATVIRDLASSRGLRADAHLSSRPFDETLFDERRSQLIGQVDDAGEVGGRGPVHVGPLGGRRRA